VERPAKKEGVNALGTKTEQLEQDRKEKVAAKGDNPGWYTGNPQVWKGGGAKHGDQSGPAKEEPDGTGGWKDEGRDLKSFNQGRWGTTAQIIKYLWGRRGGKAFG